MSEKVEKTNSHLSQSFHVDLGTPQFLPRMMPVTTTFSHATELTGRVKHIHNKWTATHLILRYLTTTHNSTAYTFWQEYYQNHFLLKLT